MFNIWFQNIIAFFTLKSVSLSGDTTLWHWIRRQRQISYAKKHNICFNKNKLPICVFASNGAVLEHEHADHPYYQFPVTVNLIDRKTQTIASWEKTDWDHVRDGAFLGVTDNNIIKIIFETCTGDFDIHTGISINDQYLWENDDDYFWQISPEDLKKIHDWAFDEY